MTDQTITVAQLIDALKNYPLGAPVYIHDADTDWPLALQLEGLRIGRDQYGNGVDSALMIKSVGY